MSGVIGIDVSTHAVHLVLLDDDTDGALAWRIDLPGRADLDLRQARIEQVHAIRRSMPRRSWLEQLGVWLIGIEDPVGRFAHTAKALGIITGAVLAMLPPELPKLPVSPTERFKAITGHEKMPRRSADIKDAIRIAVLERLSRADGGIALPDEPDAYDAYAVAYAARALNAAAIAAEKGAA